MKYVFILTSSRSLIIGLLLDAPTRTPMIRLRLALKAAYKNIRYSFAAVSSSSDLWQARIRMVLIAAPEPVHTARE